MVPWRNTVNGRGGGRALSAAALALIVAALMLVAAGCGGDDDDGSDASDAPAETGGGGEGEPAAATYGQCEIQGEPGTIAFETESDGVLVVGYTSIAPSTYDGDTEESVDDGFNYCFAAEIANAAGIPELRLKRVDFAQLIVGREAGYDIAIDSFYIKPEREEHIDFSIPYGASWSGVVARGDDIPDQSEFKDLKMGVTLGSAQQIFLDEVLMPSQQYNTYDDPVAMFAALRANQIDLALIDMPVALAAACESDGEITTIAEITAGGETGVIMEQPSPNKAAVDQVVQRMLDDGQLKSMEEKYFYEAFCDVDPDTLESWDP
jgi:polar amino acid transport system substrate-binding protein